MAGSGVPVTERFSRLSITIAIAYTLGQVYFRGSNVFPLFSCNQNTLERIPSTWLGIQHNNYASLSC